MINLKRLEAWFITGSQHLYGPETLAKLPAHSKEIARAYATPVPGQGGFQAGTDHAGGDHRAVPGSQCRPQLHRPDHLDAHLLARPRCGSTGLQLSTNRSLHLHTQYNRDIPWSTIDMDFMNLNQAAHGDREFGFIMSRHAAGPQSRGRATGRIPTCRRSWARGRAPPPPGTTARARSSPASATTCAR